MDLKQRNVRRIIDNLIIDASIDSIVSTNKRPVGFFVKRLDDKDRETLKTATSKDFETRK